MHITDREGRPFLNGEQFPEEKLRILGVVIELAKTGERNPDLLCERIRNCGRHSPRPCVSGSRGGAAGSLGSLPRPCGSGCGGGAGGAGPPGPWWAAAPRRRQAPRVACALGGG